MKNKRIKLKRPVQAVKPSGDWSCSHAVIQRHLLRECESTRTMLPEGENDLGQYNDGAI